MKHRVCAFCGKGVTKRDNDKAALSFCNMVCYVSYLQNPRKIFWSKVTKTESCWIWRGHTYPDGYGQLKWRTRPTRAHRVSWIIHFGPIPTGKQVLHRCDNPKCVNPDHLFLGTNLDNMTDKKNKGRCNNGGGGKLKGELHGRHKLKDSDILEIRRRRSSGETYLSIAASFGVGITTIYKIINNQSWKHIL